MRSSQLRTVRVLPSGVEPIMSRVFGYYNQGNSITERVSKEESILCRVSGKNRIFSIRCRWSVEIRFTNLLSPKKAEDNHNPSGHKQFILAVTRQLSSECRYMQVKSEKDLSCLHRVPLCLSDSITSRVPASNFFSIRVLPGVFKSQISALRVSGPRVLEQT